MGIWKQITNDIKLPTSKMGCWYIQSYQKKCSKIKPLNAAPTPAKVNICSKFIPHTTNELNCTTCNHSIVDHACCEKFNVWHLWTPVFRPQIILGSFNSCNKSWVGFWFNNFDASKGDASKGDTSSNYYKLVLAIVTML